MKVIIFLIAIIFEGVFGQAQLCETSKCKLQDNCVCSSINSPLANTATTPQFVTLTFDDSVTSLVHDTYLEKLLSNRKNPDGSPIGASFYVPHQYTDYQKVNSLYNKGYEIGVNSISKGDADYFQTASVDVLVDEFLGQRQLIAKFANISIEDIKGVRTPHLGLTGDSSFSAFEKSGLDYDNSWTTLASAPLHPYTLNYKSEQQCLIGTCPVQTHPGFWVLPITNFVGDDNNPCNVLFGCRINGTTGVSIKDWLVGQYERSKNWTRAPISLLVNSAWFGLSEESFNGLALFLDYLGTNKDTFLVSHREVLRWSKNPVPVETYKPEFHTNNQNCFKVTCPLPFGSEVRYMVSCTPCPRVYPWVGNPEGKILSSS